MTRALVAAIVVCLASGRADARPVAVASADQLLAAIADAQPGDVITLAPGTYALAGASCAAVATQASPILVRADPPLGAVRIDFDGLEGFHVTGAGWHFDGLEIHGVCAVDDDCEHAFHVTGAADHFELRHSRVVDFNAQLKVNASMIGATWETPDHGVVEQNELFDTRARATGNPVTKLNIDTGDDWILRGNDLHDFGKGGGDGVSYGAFFKSGGHRGLMEHNLVRCTTTGDAGTRIGLSLGGGGTAPEFCAPAYDASVPCAIEHTDGMIRNNIIIGCSDVGIYLNRGASSKILDNTLIATGGVDFRFDTTSGEADGNLLDSMVRTRDGATVSATFNYQNADFSPWYADAPAGDLTPLGDLSVLIGHVSAHADVPDDYCGQLRPPFTRTPGAIEYLVGDCALGPTVTPDAGPGGGDDEGDDIGTSDGGCCSTGGGGGAAGSLVLALGLVTASRTRRRRSGAARPTT